MLIPVFMICSLAYLHEAIDPKVVHRDIKSSNILIDDEFNSKVSDFGLAKLLNSDKSHINTRVMGTYGYRSVFIMFLFLLLALLFIWKTGEKFPNVLNLITGM